MVFFDSRCIYTAFQKSSPYYFAITCPSVNDSRIVWQKHTSWQKPDAWQFLLHCVWSIIFEIVLIVFLVYFFFTTVYQIIYKYYNIIICGVFIWFCGCCLFLYNLCKLPSTILSFHSSMLDHMYLLRDHCIMYCVWSLFTPLNHSHFSFSLSLMHESFDIFCFAWVDL